MILYLLQNQKDELTKLRDEAQGALTANDMELGIETKQMQAAGILKEGNANA